MHYSNAAAALLEQCIGAAPAQTLCRLSRAQTPKMFELMSLQTTGLLNSKCLHRASVIGETGSCCFFTNAIYYAGFRISMGGFCFYN
jgi:energy-converting hydrogenase Eha subunit H